MQREDPMLRSRMIKYSLFLLVLIIPLACRQSIHPMAIPSVVFNSPTDEAIPPTEPVATKAIYLPVIRHPDDITISTPTPDMPRELPEIRVEDDHYVVQRGEALGIIAARYEITVQMLLEANHIINPDLLEGGQELGIPAPLPRGPG